MLISRVFISSLRCLAKNRHAAVAIEFAIILPLMLAMTIPMYDFFTYIMYAQKLSKTAANIADMIVLSDGDITGALPLTRASLDNIHSTSNFLMQPYDFTRPGEQFITTASVYDPPGIQGPGIYWIYEYNGVNGAPLTTCTAATAHQGQCSLENQNPTNDPNNFQGTFLDAMDDGENMIMVRACSDFTPIFDWSAFTPIFDAAPVTPGVFNGDCATGKMQIVRYFPVRNGPLLQIF
jgi:hypothetical protein